MLIILWACSSLRAQTLRRPIASSYTSIGAYSIHQTDIFSVATNAASLAQLSAAAIGVYSEQRFMLKVFTQTNMVAALKSDAGNIALGVDHFGDRYYQETTFGGYYARSLGAKVDVGIGFHYNRMRIPGYLRLGSLSADLGLMMHFTEKLHGGFSVNYVAGNPLHRAPIKKMIPVIRSGLGYEVSEVFFLSVEVIKIEGSPASVLTGFQYRPVAVLQLRGGINAISHQPFLGVGVRLGQICLDVTAAYHLQLGFSPGCMLRYDFKKSVQ